MDVATLTKDVVGFLTPFLPYLLKAGEKAAEGIWGQAAWESAKTLWGKLRPKVEAKPAALEAVHDVAANPQDPDAAAALRLQMRKLLQDDQALAAEIARLWGEAQAASVTVFAGADRSVAIGGDVNESTIVTGNRNTVQQGKLRLTRSRA